MTAEEAKNYGVVDDILTKQKVEDEEGRKHCKPASTRVLP